MSEHTTTTATNTTELPDDTIRRLAHYLTAVAELHEARRRDIDGYTLVWCRECNQNWPCPTIEACHG